MTLLKNIMIGLLEKEEISIMLPNLKTDINKIIETECYKKLEKIKTIIEDDSLSDFECIEQIVCVFETLGSGGGNRHDFG